MQNPIWHWEDFPGINAGQKIESYKKYSSHWITYIKDYLSHLTDLDQKKQLRKRKKQDEKSTSRPQQRKTTNTDSESITSEDEVKNYDSEGSEVDLVLNVMGYCGQT